MKKQDYSSPTIIQIKLEEQDVITTSRGVETSILESSQNEWEW